MPSEQSTVDVVQEQINKAYRLGVNFERERCAKIAEKTASEWTSRSKVDLMLAYAIASAIRKDE